MDGQTFEDFCADLDYDSDSRSAERIFRRCRDTYFGLILLLGTVDFDVLSQLFQDYY